MRRARQVVAGIREEEDAALRSYFEEISRIPLLSAEQERALITRKCAGQPGFWRGKRYHDVNGPWPRDARAARDLLVASNLRLVVLLAKRYNTRSLTLLDLIQEGNIGLMRAVDRMRADMHNKLDTYASFWIRQAIGRAIQLHDSTIQVPVYLSSLRSRVNRIRNLTLTDGGQPLTDEQLVASGEVTRDMLSLLQMPTLAATTSLDAPTQRQRALSHDDDFTLNEVIAAQDEPLDESMAEQDMRARLHEALCAVLSPREREVLALRFGFGAEALTLEEAGRRLGITRERVRQIQERAIGKLQRHLKRDDAGGIHLVMAGVRQGQLLSDGPDAA